MEFTYFGDLLGVSSYYHQSSQVAYKKLNAFYNTAFNELSGYCKENADTHVYMFSDSILIYGQNALAILTELQRIYLALLDQDIFLRGAMVNNALQTEPRLTLDNFQKFLPHNDTLARAVSLEKTQKGVRLLIENKLAEKLLGEASNTDWLTVEGYLRNFRPTTELSNTLRLIAPTPDNRSYELLYFWENRTAHNTPDLIYEDRSRQLKDVAIFLDDTAAVHFTETMKLLDRSRHRDRMTSARL